MFSWTPYSFVRFVLVFAAGILLAIYAPGFLPENLSELFFGVLAIFFAGIAFLRFKNGRKLFNPGSIGLLILFLAGYIRVFYSTDSHQPDHILNAADTIQHYKAVIIKQAQEKENSWKMEARVIATQDKNNGWKERTGKVLLYFSRKAYANPFHYGDVLLIAGSPKILSEPANPGEFDYKRFLTFKKIYHQHFLREGDVLLIEHQPPTIVIDYSIKARVWASEALTRNIHSKQEQVIASALVLGVTDGLDNELTNAYAATGSMHVLAVSGLHVGIIYWMILLVLYPLNRYPKGKWVVAFLSVFILWSYAFITGLSPSVLRAVTMFSFIAFARPWGQRSNIYNTLGASAFCLLLYEPYLIMSVGFQLSYLAVIGIVYLQPKLYLSWNPKSFLLDKIWQITCVSLAAQAATVSLGLLYFHQFPVYFLFSNLFVIPGAFSVLVLGIVLIGVSMFQPLAYVAGFLLEWAIRALNFGVFSVEAFPYSLIENIYITSFQCWLLMGMLVGVFFLIQYKRFEYALLTTGCIILFSTVQWIHYYNDVDQASFVVYNVAGHSAMDIVDRGNTYLFTDSILKNDGERLRFHIRPNRLQRGVRNIQSGDHQNFVREFKGCRLIQWNNTTILQLQHKAFSLPDSLIVDYVMVGGNSIQHINQLSSVKFKHLILDSSNSFYFANKIVKEADTSSIPIYSVLHNGAYTAKL